MISRLIIGISILSLAFIGVKERRDYVLNSCSQFIIKGTTNIHKFSCSFDESTLSNDTFSITFENIYGQIQLQDALIELPVKYFDCGLQAMNKDLRELLQADENPNIIVEVTDLHLPSNKDLLQSISANTSVTIASVTNNYKIEGKAFKSGNDITYTGNLHINLTDFQIEPPKKALGIIKVQDEFVVTVNLAISQVPI
jgi:hypothetical protein